jgi:hypothetical protein
MGTSDESERRTITVELGREDYLLLLAGLTKYVEWFDEHSRLDDRRSHPQAQVDDLRARARRVTDLLSSAWGPPFPRRDQVL